MIDLNTLRITIILISIVCVLALITVWRINKNLVGVVQWMWGVSLNTFSFFIGLAAALGVIHISVSTFLSNVLTLCALAILLEGSLRFRSFPSTHRWKAIFGLLPLFMLATWVNMENTTGRYLFHDSIAFILLISTSVVMAWKCTSSDELRVYGLVSLFSTLMAAAFLTRWIYAWNGWLVSPESQLLTSSVLFLGVLLYVVGLSFSFVAACYYKSHQSVLQLAGEDTLTGLPNRRRLDEFLTRTLSLARRSNNPFAVVLIDLNEFKQVNDTLGHAAGDGLLVEVGKRLAAFVRESDFVGRLGGDEFLLILGDVDDAVSAQMALERLHSQLDGSVKLYGQSVAIRISVGLAMWPVDGDSLDGLLRTADRRMYAEKHTQRDPFTPQTELMLQEPAQSAAGSALKSSGQTS